MRCGAQVRLPADAVSMQHKHGVYSYASQSKLRGWQTDASVHQHASCCGAFQSPPSHQVWQSSMWHMQPTQQMQHTTPLIAACSYNNASPSHTSLYDGLRCWHTVGQLCRVTQTRACDTEPAGSSYATGFVIDKVRLPGLLPAAHLGRVNGRRVPKHQPQRMNHCHAAVSGGCALTVQRDRHKCSAVLVAGIVVLHHSSLFAAMWLRGSLGARVYHAAAHGAKPAEARQLASQGACSGSQAADMFWWLA